MKNAVLTLMRERNITLEKIAELTYILQKDYYDSLDMQLCIEAVDAVLNKRDVRHTVLTGLALDIAAEQKSLPEALEKIIAEDAALYGTDEVLGMAIADIYGTIGVTGFGYLDKLKIGLVGELDSDPMRVNTFADDLAAAIAAAAAAKLAHSMKREE